MDPRKYPVKVATELSYLLRDTRAEIVKNHEYVLLESDGLPFVVKDIFSDHRFRILEANGLTNNKTQLNISYSPASNGSNLNKELTIYIEEVENLFKGWLERIIQYSTIVLTAEDHLKQTYERQFYHHLNLNEKEADTEPFETNLQISLFDYLQSIKETLTKEYEGQDWVNIVEAINQLQNKITKISRNETMHSIGAILSMVKYKGISEYKIFCDVAKKEGYKYVLFEGIRQISATIDFFNQHPILGNIPGSQ